MGVLNVRLAARLLQMSADTPVDRQTLIDHLTTLRRLAGRRTTPHRAPLTDDQVREFILANLTGRSTHSAMLRQLRDSGLACEQKRFADLFAATLRST